MITHLLHTRFNCPGLLLTALLSLAVLTGAIAQPTLSSTNVQTGQSFDIYQLNGVNTSDIAPSGANVTWDLSSATVGALQGHIDFVDPASTGYAATYPTANFVMKFNIGGNIHYNFSRVTTTVWEEMALNEGTPNLQTFSNNRTVLPFVDTYGRSDTDTYQKNGQSAATIIHKYDAYGTVHLSTGDITGLVRDLSTDGGSGSDQAIWWRTAPIAPVLVGSGTNVTLWQVTTPNAVPDINKGVSFHLYPNPAMDQLQILNEKPLDNVSICNMNGRVVLTSTQSVVDISGLAPAVYIIRASGPDGIETARFVKE